MVFFRCCVVCVLVLFFYRRQLFCGLPISIEAGRTTTLHYILFIHSIRIHRQQIIVRCHIFFLLLNKQIFILMLKTIKRCISTNIIVVVVACQ